MDSEKEVFISFSSVENDEAMRIVNMLEGEGLSCFISSRDLTAGIEYAGQLVDFIDKAKVLVLLLSKASNASPHVLREIEYAVSHRVPIVVYKLEEVELSRSLEYFLMTHQWLHAGSDIDRQLVTSVRMLKGDKKGLENGSDRQPVVAAAKKKTDTSPLVMIGAIAIIVLLMICVIFLAFSLGRMARTDSSQAKEVVSDEEMLGATGEEEEATEAVSYELGDTITFGHYNGEPIEWRVLELKDDDTMMLVSKYILTVKSFDAAEGGKYGQYGDVDSFSYSFREVTDEDIIVKVLGNNDWTCSNLRTWLNSDKEVVSYQDQEPSKSAVYDGVNSYNNEPGFLYNFTDEEKAALIPTKLKVKANSFSRGEKDGAVYSEDLVYLLSEKQLKLFGKADMLIYAEVTPEAEEEDGSGYIKDVRDYYDTKYYYWWLIDGADYIGKVKMVNTEYEGDEGYALSDTSAASTYVGVRPAITLSQNYGK